MKITSPIQTLKSRHESDPRSSRGAQRQPLPEQAYQNSQLLGSCGTPTKFHHPAFFELSKKYFADEAPRGFALEASVFATLILTALLPIVNGLQAVATLLH